MKIRWLPALVLSLLSILAVASTASGQAAHVRWDIVSLDFSKSPVPVTAGGHASAFANDQSHITLTGSGTFVAPAGGDGTSSAATGGGTWHTFNAGGTSTGNGTYSVTGLVRWEPAPGTLPPGIVDLIGNSADLSAGLAVLRIEYSDGSAGVLVVSCNLSGTPASVFEGVTRIEGLRRLLEPAGAGRRRRRRSHRLPLSIGAGLISHGRRVSSALVVCLGPMVMSLTSPSRW